MTNKEAQIDKVYSYLTIISEEFRKNGKLYVLTRCKCGNEKEILSYSVYSGGTKSCGCLRKETIESKIGKDSIRANLRSRWTAMLKRCLNPKSEKYKNYGARGIKIDPLWVEFENFYIWAMQSSFSTELMLDRIDVNGDYTPSNCRWISSKHSANNTTKTVYFEAFGENKSIYEWSLDSRCAVEQKTLWQRIDRIEDYKRTGWTPEMLITQGKKRGQSITRKEYKNKRVKGRKSEAFSAKIGDKIGNFEVIGEPVKKGNIWCLQVRCICGSERTPVYSELKLGKVKSCGCIGPQLENKEYDPIKESLRARWGKILSKCNNPSDNEYEEFGKIGVKVCQDWQLFENFYKWAIDSGFNSLELWIHKHSESTEFNSETCNVVSRKEAYKDSKRRLWLTAFGETKLVEDWLDDIRCIANRDMINNRLHDKNYADWSHEKIISTGRLKEPAKYKNFLTDIKIGDSFNYLTVSEVPFREGKVAKAVFECVCGNKKLTRISDVLSDNVKSCGCKTSELISAAMKARLEDSRKSKGTDKIKIGDIFEKLTVISEPFKDGTSMVVECLCECGTKRTATLLNLVNDKAKMCINCVSQYAANHNITHGGHGSVLYGRWQGILNRCYNVKNAGYPDYGGRNIDVCPEWREDFSAFRDWAIANGFQKELQLDRIDNNKGYSPENCRFISPKKNCNNRRSTKMITAFGETKSADDWTEDERCNVSQLVLTTRFRKNSPSLKSYTSEELITKKRLPNMLKGVKASVYITAWEETKSIYQWVNDSRCVVKRGTLESRIKQNKKTGYWTIEEILSLPKLKKKTLKERRTTNPNVTK